MPGYHVHSFMTAAVFDPNNRPIPAGLLVDFDFPYAGTLLFMSDPSHDPNNYEVYHSLSNDCMGPFSQAYAFLGKIHEVYAVRQSMEIKTIWISGREVHSDPRLALIRRVCGYGKPIHQIWAFTNWQRGLDLYVQTIGQPPFDVFAHYWVDVADPSDWWRAQTYQFVDIVTMPDWAWAPPRPRSAM